MTTTTHYSISGTLPSGAGLINNIPRAAALRLMRYAIPRTAEQRRLAHWDRGRVRDVALSITGSKYLWAGRTFTDVRLSVVRQVAK